MGWSSCIHITCGVEYSGCGAAGTGAGCCTGCRFFSDTSGSAGGGPCDATAAAESFHDGAAIDRGTAAHV
jgi:hypothetical protein